MTPTAVAVVGPGRVGLTLARALVHSGVSVRLLGRVGRLAEGDIPEVEVEWGRALMRVHTIILAVPDDAIADVAATLAHGGTVTEDHTVLHTSGLHGKGVLDALAPLGVSLGSLHPLQAFPAGAVDREALVGIPAIIEGDAPALKTARALALQLRMAPILELSAAGKVGYHAAAVIASNYVVVLADVAERLAREAGAGNAAATLFQPIMRQTLANIATQGSVTALTGPIRRGDLGTVAAHLAALRGVDRAAYISLGREALALARRAGLPAANANELERLLHEAESIAGA